MNTVRAFKSVSVLRLMILAAATSLVGGCATQAQPNYFNGKYYMAGDANCKLMRPERENVIQCLDSSGNFKEFRSAISQQQANYVYAQQYQQQVQMQQLNQQMQQFNQQMQQQNQAFQQSQQYNAPQVTPLNQPGDNQIRCINTGVVTNCRY